MKLVKGLPVLAAAAALTAVSATSAMAMEHQFGGAFTVYSDISNFNGSRTGNWGYFPEGIDKKAPSANYIESRARIGYTAKANNDLKFVSMFELDYNYWGNSSYTNARGGGGALGADTVNIETKNLYLDANVAKNTNVKLGMQGFDDAFKGVFVGADMAGLLLTHSYDKATASVGVFRWDDKSPIVPGSGDVVPVTALGRQTRDYIVLDGKFDLNKHTKLGAAYYFMKDNAKTNGVSKDTVHMVGVNAEAEVGIVTLDGFVATQFGEVEVTDKKLAAYAASVGAKAKLGKGLLRTDFLYTSGDNGNVLDKRSHAWQSTSFESGYYAHEMVILGRDKNAFTIDNAIVYEANNRNRGVLFAAVGYDLPLSSKLSCSANLGFAWNDKVTDGRNKYLGTEANAELVYKATENVSLSARGAYVVLGDYFRNVATNGTPDDPYDFKLIAKYSF